jgi:hypothetical protein
MDLWDPERCERFKQPRALPVVSFVLVLRVLSRALR